MLVHQRVAVLLPESCLKCEVRSLISTKTHWGLQLHHFQADLAMGVANPTGYPKSLTTGAAQSKRAVTGSLLHDVFRQLHVLKPRLAHIEASQKGLPPNHYIIWLGFNPQKYEFVSWDYEIPNMMGKNNPFMFQTTKQL